MNRKRLLLVALLAFFLMSIIAYTYLNIRESNQSFSFPSSQKLIIKISNAKKIDKVLNKPIVAGHFDLGLAVGNNFYLKQLSGLKRINENGRVKMIHQLESREEIGGVAIDNKGLVYTTIAKTVPLEGTGEAVVENAKVYIIKDDRVIRTVDLPKQAYRDLRISKNGQMVVSNLHGYANREKRNKIYFVDLNGEVKRIVDLGHREQTAAFFDIDSNNDIYVSSLANANPFLIKVYKASDLIKEIRIDKLSEYMRFVGIDGKGFIYISGDGYPKNFLYKFSSAGKLVEKDTFKAGLGSRSQYRISDDGRIFLYQTGKDNIIRLHRIQ